MDNDTTIGTDLGNKSHKVVWLDERGRVCLGCEFENAKETLEAFVREHPNATVALETKEKQVPAYYTRAPIR